MYCAYYTYSCLYRIPFAQLSLYKDTNLIDLDFHKTGCAFAYIHMSLCKLWCQTTTQRQRRYDRKHMTNHAQ